MCVCLFSHTLSLFFFFYNFVLSFFSIHYIGVAPTVALTVAPTVADITTGVSLSPIFQFITSFKQVVATVVITVANIAPRNATRFVRWFNALNHNR